MPQLKLPALPIRIHIIRHRRPAQPNRLRQNRLHRLIQRRTSRSLNFVPSRLRMNLRAPQTLIRINISHPAKHALIHQQRLDPRAPARQSLAEIPLRSSPADRLPTGPSRVSRSPSEQNPNPPKSPDIRVTKLAPIIQRQKRHAYAASTGASAGAHHDLPRHAQMNQQRDLPAVFRRSRARSRSITRNFP